MGLMCKVVLFIFVVNIVLKPTFGDEEREVLQSKEDENEEEFWDGNLNIFEKDPEPTKGDTEENNTRTTEKVQEKKIKIKKKDKKVLLKVLTAGLLVKSAFLPLAVGFLKLLTAKALMITMMALTLILAITFRGATEKKGSTTEIINLTPHGHHRRSLDFPQEMVPILTGEFPKKFKR